MPPLREIIKRTLPPSVRGAVVNVRTRLAAPPLEDIVLHGYKLVPDTQVRPRLSLVIPSVAPASAFGGVTTGLEIFLEIGKRTGADLRIIVDDFERTTDIGLVVQCSRNIGFDHGQIDIVPRTADTPCVETRATDVFYTFNWWTTLNIRSLLRQQNVVFGGAKTPHLYAIQEYEPLFYPLSSTHMSARLAFEPTWPCWGMFNSSELHNFFLAQGHQIGRAFVFEPKISNQLRPFLGGEEPTKARRILVYARPSIPRNCYSAVEKGLRSWAEEYSEFQAWKVVSAGLPHKPLQISSNRTMEALGKLSLEQYAELMRTSAVGLSLMASPHPSYPPLEMAHFGLRTVTNTYTNKNLTLSHPNIISIDDISPDTIADALARACRAFETEPRAGWLTESGRPSFLEPNPFSFLDEISAALAREVWGRPT